MKLHQNGKPWKHTAETTIPSKMKALIVTTMIVLGGIWLFYATMVPSVMRLGAMSDAAQLEANLHRWAMGKVDEGKLTEEDVREIFPKGHSLRFGGEDPNRNFHEMIDHIAQSSAPPVWPGVVLVIVGIIGAIRLPGRRQTKRRGMRINDPSHSGKPREPGQ